MIVKFVCEYKVCCYCWVLIGADVNDIFQNLHCNVLGNFNFTREFPVLLAGHQVNFKEAYLATDLSIVSTYP